MAKGNRSWHPDVLPAELREQVHGVVKARAKPKAKPKPAKKSAKRR